MAIGKLIKTLLIMAGIGMVLAVCGNMFQLRDPDQPRIINPSNPIELPKVNVSKR